MSPFRSPFKFQLCANRCQIVKYSAHDELEYRDPLPVRVLGTNGGAGTTEGV